jgi:hypothetical protein
MPHLRPATWILIVAAALVLLWIGDTIWFGLTQAR